MMSLSSAPWSSATWPRSRCNSRSSRRGAPARRHLSGCAPARRLLPRRIGGPRRRDERRCNRFRRRDSRGRAGTADKGKSARIRKNRNRPARPVPGRRRSDRDISAIWDRARCVCARRVPFFSSAPAPAGGGPPCAAGWWRGRRRQRNLNAYDCALKRSSSETFLLSNEQTKNLTTVISRQRQRSGTASAPSTTVRSLRELQWPPSPAIAGAESNRVLAARCAPEFCSKNESH